jgi:hypothetical protein
VNESGQNLHAQRYSGHGSPGIQVGFTQWPVMIGKITAVVGTIGVVVEASIGIAVIGQRYSGQACPGVQTGFTHLCSRGTEGGAVVLSGLCSKVGK